MASRAGSTPRRQRAPRGTLNPAVIVKAAIKVIDTEGVEALTLSRLADDLGVRSMALYTHFRDKNAILLAVSAELFKRFQMPERSTDPIETLRRLMHAYFELLVENRALLQADGIFDEISSGEARFYEAVYTCTADLRLDRLTAAGHVNTMIRFVIGCAYLYPLRRAFDDPELEERNRRRVSALPAAIYPTLHEMGRELPIFTQRKSFEVGLEIQLEALARAADLDSGGNG
jgi:AcrR family transcriptional regulator